MAKELEGQFYQFHRRFISAGAATEDIDTERVDPGHILKVRLACGTNYTADYTRLEIYISDGVIHRKIYNFTTALANAVYGKTQVFYVPEGYFVRIRFVGNTANDIYEGYVQGFLLELK